MDVDVTHAVDGDSATVVLYSREERLDLLESGFGAETLIPDLAAADAADRRAEGRAMARGDVPALPSGRTQYRQYMDYTDELTDLAEAEPDDRPRGDDRHLAREPPDPGHRDRRRRQRDRRRPAGLREHGRPPRPRVAFRRVPDGVRHRPRREPRHRPADRGAARGRPDPRDPDRQRRRVHRVAELRDVGRGRQPERDSGPVPRRNRRVPAQELPPGLARGRGAQLRHAHVGRRPQPQLRRVLGRAGLVDGPDLPELPRRRARSRSPSRRPSTELSSGLHPTVFISNHTFTDDGKWLRQPGFDAPFLPQDSIGATTPGRGGDEGPRRRHGRRRPDGRPSAATRPSATSPARPRTGTTSPRAPTATRPRRAGSTSTRTTRTR